MTKKEVEVKEETSSTSTFVDTLWNQYEQSLEWSRKYRENREDAYLKAVKQVTNLNKQYRNSLVNLYQQSRKTNGEIVKEVSSSLINRDEFEITGQVQDVTTRFEEIALTPVKLTFDLFDRLDKNLEENSENLVRYAREQRTGWQKLTNEYISSARTNQKKLLGRIEESLKVLAITR